MDMGMDMDMNGHYDHHPKQPKQKRRNKIKSILIMITSLFIKENAKNAKNAANLTYQHFLHPVNSGCFSYYGVSPGYFHPKSGHPVTIHKKTLLFSSLFA
ncbi:hypothetical protein S100072_01924 [Bacillus velezensis]|nr:hypothetical protein S100072_01924 [Bacillus velezensis]